VGATVSYGDSRVQIEDFKGRHGASQFALERGEIWIKAKGGYYARLRRLQAQALHPDDSLFEALPVPLAKAVRGLGLPGDRPLDIESLVIIDQAEDPGRPPVLFWDGEARLHNSRLEFGAAFDQVEGVIACRGRHDGTTLEGLAGNVLLDR